MATALRGRGTKKEERRSGGLTLTERARMLSQLLQRSGGGPVDFEEMAEVLARAVDASVFVLARSGRLLGYHVFEALSCELAPGRLASTGQLAHGPSQALLEVRETEANRSVPEGQCMFDPEVPCTKGTRIMSVVPIVGAGQRLGTLVLARDDTPFSEQDLVLADWGATVAGLEILRVKTQEIEEEARQKAAVQVAIGTLSFSELEAVQHIFEELDGREGLLVASRIADRIGITRSVIVNALRKFESAGVIESRSLGMKGTHIKVLNDYLLPELDRIRSMA